MQENDRAGEKTAGQDLECLMRLYGNDVLRTAYLYVKDAQIAEDMFQEVFLKVNRNLDSFRGESSIKTWMIRITINTCKDYLKSAYHNKVVPMMDFMEESIASEEEFDRIEKKETAHTVKEAVMALPETYKDVVLCVYYQDMSMDDTAQYLNVPVGTVKSRLSRAKEKLRSLVEGRLS
ncbi:MAG: sigma-70 family RNA polymerase sigma factor [Lachnospiraceae bacterium]|nr:sigma-70 family RNA polymerase sigma factor [Lachnospiraceae bacterium]